MRSFRIVAPVVLGAALAAVAVAPQVGASSTATEPIVPDRGPVAYAAGGDAAPPPLPSIVDVRVVRSEAALDRAAALVDQGQASPAVAALSSAVWNMNKAWSAARWVVKTAPPPPVAADGRVHAHSSGGAVASPTATPEDTVLAVLGLQHVVLTTAMGLTNGPNATLAPAIDSAISAAITARNTTIKYIHFIAPTPPPVAGDGRVHGRVHARVHAHSSGGAIASTWATVMPGVIPQLDDELQMAALTKKVVPTSPIDVQKVTVEVTTTKNTVNQYWPPIPAEG